MDQATNPLLIRLLCVEDNDDDWVELQSLLALSKTYSEFDLSWHRCKSAHQAKVEIETGQHDVILLDLKLVDSPNPLETTQSVSEVAAPMGIPIVSVSGLLDDPTISRECSRAGAFHHLQKGSYDELTLLSAIRLCYQRNQELQRQRDLFFEAERSAVENLALAEQATGILTGLRSDLDRFTKTEHVRKCIYSVIAVVVAFCVLPSLDAEKLKVKVTNEGMTLLIAGMSIIWGHGSFHERVKQGSEAVELVDAVRSRKKGGDP